MNAHEECIVYLLAKAYQKAHGSLKRRLKPIGLTPAQGVVLAAVADEEGLIAGEIGRRLVLDNATLSGVLDRLAEAGWIVKEKDPGDMRVVRVFLSEKSRGMRDRIIEERDKANEDILKKLTVEERILLKRLLRDVEG